MGLEYLSGEVPERQEGHFIMMDEMYKSIFMDKPWNIDYDCFNLEINVRKRATEHNVRCIYDTKGDYKEAFASIFHFFNELVWFYDLRVSNVNGGHSEGSHVVLNYTVNSDQYLLGFKQRVCGELQHLSLAFFREAKCNESPFYRFLCFRKILEIPRKGDKHFDKGKWIEAQLKELKSETAKRASTFLDTKIGDMSLADWLYKKGRHAIAHGDRNIVRDPNDYDDWDEIRWANEIMQELAETLIITLLGVPAVVGWVEPYPTQQN